MSSTTKRSKKYRKPRYNPASHGNDTHRRRELVRGAGFCLDDDEVDLIGQGWIEEERRGPRG